MYFQYLYKTQFHPKCHLRHSCIEPTISSLCHLMAKEEFYSVGSFYYCNLIKSVSSEIDSSHDLTKRLLIKFAMFLVVFVVVVVVLIYF